MKRKPAHPFWSFKTTDTKLSPRAEMDF